MNAKHWADAVKSARSSDIDRLWRAHRISPLDEDGNTLLHLAAIEDNHAAVQRLIELGFDLEVRNKDGESPLFSASLGGNYQSMQLLLNAGADPNAQDQGMNSPLHASALNSEECVRLLIEAGSSVNARNCNGFTPIVFTMNRPPIYDALVDNGASVFVITNEGESLLHFAVASGAEDMVSKLLREGLNPEIKNANNKTPMMLANGLPPEKRKAIKALFRSA